MIYELFPVNYISHANTGTKTPHNGGEN